jgi:hypothetical protein
MLHFPAKPPFAFEKFLQICADFIPRNDADMLKSFPLPDIYDYAFKQPTLEKWLAFDIALRNELVKIRASRRKIEADKYLRKDGYTEYFIAQIALSAYRSPSIIEAERILAQERWHKLDELATGHYFDIDFLIVYAIKLLILERWHRINTADKSRILEDILQNS